MFADVIIELNTAHNLNLEGLHDTLLRASVRIVARSR